MIVKPLQRETRWANQFGVEKVAVHRIDLYDVRHLNRLVDKHRRVLGVREVPSARKT